MAAVRCHVAPLAKDAPRVESRTSPWCIFFSTGGSGFTQNTDSQVIESSKRIAWRSLVLKEEGERGGAIPRPIARGLYREAGARRGYITHRHPAKLVCR